jgi:hypothetical protein
MPYYNAMHTVVETPAYLVSAAKAGMSQEERVVVVDQIAANPQAGEIISGGGGIRKVRVAGRGKGKSGGYRVLTYYMTENEPVYLISVINKSKATNLSDAQKAAVKSVAKDLRYER